MMTLEEVGRLVPINKHNLDEELATQAEVMFRIAEAKAKAASRMQDAKDALATEEARLYIGERRSGEKMTALEMTSKVQASPRRLKAYDAYQEARHAAEQWDDLFEIWKQRGFALRTLTDLYLGNYYTSDSRTGGSGRERRITTSGSQHSDGSSRRRQ